MENPNICVIKVANGTTMALHNNTTDPETYGADQTAFQALGDALVSEHHGGSASLGTALCGAAEWRTAIEDGARDMDADVNVLLKSEVTTETIIPPEGVAIAAIPSSDYVVCYT